MEDGDCAHGLAPNTGIPAERCAPKSLGSASSFPLPLVDISSRKLPLIRLLLLFVAKPNRKFGPAGVQLHDVEIV